MRYFMEVKIYIFFYLKFICVYFVDLKVKLDVRIENL